MINLVNLITFFRAAKKSEIIGRTYGVYFLGIAKAACIVITENIMLSVRKVKGIGEMQMFLLAIACYPRKNALDCQNSQKQTP